MSVANLITPFLLVTIGSIAITAYVIIPAFLI